MNENLQPDLHPEAEMLNAFAEHALSDNEQQQIVTHLAACSRCRQIVFLAQQAAEEELPAIAGPAIATPVEISRRNWWSDWRILWIAAPACAALLTVVFLLHPRQIPPTAQQAKAVPHASASTSNARPQSTTAPQPTMQMDLKRQGKAPAPSVSQSSPQSPSLQLLPKPAAEQARQPEPKQAPQSAAQTVSVSAAEVITTDATVSPEPAPQQIAPLPAPAPAPAPAAANTPKPPATATHIVPPPPPHFAPPSDQPGSGHGFIQGGVALRPSLPPTGRAMIPATQKQAMAAARMRVSPASLADAEAARKILYTKLPNGLTAVSTAATQHRVLALDTAGALFRSEDQGTTWLPITGQWTGRALQVRTEFLPVSASPTNPAACATCSTAATPASPQPATFQLITDAVSIWTSDDGLTWTPGPVQKSDPKPSPQK
jgi:hypothetical protein